MARDLEHASSVATDGSEPEHGEEDGEHAIKPKTCKQKCYATPHTIMKRKLPHLVGWLEAVGYDHALIMKDMTHVAIYLSCFITFIFSAMWLVDVFTLNCANPRPGDEDIGGDNAIGETYKCVFELLGGLIFFGALMDSIVMLGNYDTEHQKLLDKKKNLLEELHTDIVEALRKAKENADNLYKLLFQLYEEQADSCVRNITDVIVPILIKLLCSESERNSFEQRRHDKELILKFVQLIGDIFSEPGQLSAALARKLPDLFKNFERYIPDLKPESIAGETPPLFWRVSIQSIPEFARLLDDPNTPLSTYSSATNLDISLQSSHSSRTSTSSRAINPVNSIPETTKAEMRKSPSKFIFEPVMKMVRILENFLSKSSDITRPVDGNASADSDKLMGVGRPPWSGGEQCCTMFQCCMPRFFAFVLLNLCCFRCCCPECLRPAREGYPKRVRLGPFWFQIVSRIHERLIQGLIFTTLFAAFYTWRVVKAGWHCDHNALYGAWWACAALQLKRNALLLALLFHLPANVLCLIRIRELDAVIKIMEDIRKLQGLRSIIQDFSRTLQNDAERQALLNAVKDRVLDRMKIVDSFRRHIIHLKDSKKDEPEQLKIKLREATGEVVKYFEYAAAVLKPADKWLSLREDIQKARLDNVKEVADYVQGNGNFKYNSVPAIPSSADSSSPGPAAGIPVPFTSPSVQSMHTIRGADESRPMTPPFRPHSAPLISSNSGK